MNGERGYVLTLQTREQHIRREKATSNITTNQTLLALAGLVHLSWLGPQGLREVGETCMSLGAYAKEKLGLPLVFPEQTTFKEFAVRVGRPAREVIREARARGVHPGYAIGRDYEGMDDVLLVAVTEKRTPGGRRPPRRGAARRWPRSGARSTSCRSPAGAPRRCPATTCPAAEVPRGAAPRRAAAPARARRAGARPPLHEALDAQLRHRHGLLPARQLHDEAQPARERAARDAARLQGSPPAPGGGRRPGRARADVAAAGDPAGGGGPRRLLAAAGGRLAGRADRPDADARLLRGHRRGRAARHDRHRRHGARDEPGERDDGGLQAREGRHGRAREPRSSTTCARR